MRQRLHLFTSKVTNFQRLKKGAFLVKNAENYVGDMIFVKYVLRIRLEITACK